MACSSVTEPPARTPSLEGGSFAAFAETGTLEVKCYCARHSVLRK